MALLMPLMFVPKKHRIPAMQKTHLRQASPDPGFRHFQHLTQPMRKSLVFCIPYERWPPAESP